MVRIARRDDCCLSCLLKRIPPSPAGARPPAGERDRIIAIYADRAARRVDLFSPNPWR